MKYCIKFRFKQYQIFRYENLYQISLSTSQNDTSRTRRQSRHSIVYNFVKLDNQISLFQMVSVVPVWWAMYRANTKK